MPTYHYRSEPAIKLKDVDVDKLKGYELFIENPDDFGDSRLIWIVTHSMFGATEVKCPITGQPAIKTILGCEPTFYFKGEGLVRDKAGAYRDMNLHRLQQDDPYGHMRERGEKDDLIHRLKNGGKFNPKTQYFTP